MWWPEYHRGQAVTLVNLAQLTSDPDTAASLMRLAAKHKDLADRAQKLDEAESKRVKFVSPFAKRRKRG